MPNVRAGTGPTGNAATNAARLAGMRGPRGYRAANILQSIKSGASRIVSSGKPDAPRQTGLSQADITAKTIRDRESMLAQIATKDKVQSEALGHGEALTIHASGDTGVSVNAEQIFRVDYKQYIGASKTARGFFKSSAGVIPDSAYSAGMGGRTEAQGRERKDEDVQLVQDGWALHIRAVASSLVDTALGANLLAESVLTTLNGMDGYTAAFANGIQFRKDEKSKAKPNSVDYKYSDVDLSRSTTQKGLSNLQILDWICGQIDRHPGNLFIDPVTGQVTGIDNDLAFGTSTTLVDDFGYAIGAQRGLPSMIDAEMVATLRSLDLNGLRAGLMALQKGSSRLSDAEINAVFRRIALLMAHIAVLERDGKIVRDWNGTTYEAMTLGLKDATSTRELSKISGPNKRNLHDVIGSLERERAFDKWDAIEAARREVDKELKAMMNIFIDESNKT